MQQLQEIDKKYQGTPIGYGKGSLTYPGLNSANRCGMTAHHFDQFICLEKPEPPILATGVENIVGKYSQYHSEAKHDLLVLKKIVKYEDIVEHPNYYYLFVQDIETGIYDVIYRKPFEDLQEDYGFSYDNKYLDQLSVGDVIPANTMYSKSNSYDDYGNYSYGVNANVLFCHSPYNYEDAGAVREGFCKKMQTLEVLDIKVNNNTNEIPLNQLGGDEDYKAFADINEEVGKYLIALRPMDQSRALHDLSDRSLRQIRPTDHCKFPTTPEMIVADISIYSNKPEIEATKANAQIIKYYNSQLKYWRELYEACKEYEEKGKVSSNLDFLYDRMKLSLDTNKKWEDGRRNVYENIQIRFTLFQKVSLAKNTKIVARHGNKSVICKVIPDEEMPFADDGTKIDILFPDNSTVNRTIAACLHEHYVGFVKRRLRNEIKKMEGHPKEQGELLFDCVKMIDEQYGSEHEAIYNSLSRKEQEEYMKNLNINFRRLPFADATDDLDKTMFFSLYRIYKKYEWARRKDIFYVKKGGRIQRCLTEGCLGQLYILMLKQNGRRGHSARGAGTVNIMGLPDHSQTYKTKSSKNSTSAVRLGVQEMHVLADGASEDGLTMDQALCRTSPEGRKALLDMSLDPIGGRKRFLSKDFINSIPAEIYDVILKSLGLRRIDSSDFSKLKTLNDTKKSLHYIEDIGTYLLMTDYEYGLYLRRCDTERIIKENYGVLTTEEFIKIADSVEMDLYIDGEAYKKRREQEDGIFRQLDKKRLTGK